MPQSPATKAAQSPSGAAKVRKSRSRTPALDQQAGLNAAGGKVATPKATATPGKASTPATRHSPRIVRSQSTPQQEPLQLAKPMPTSANQAARPAAPTPKRASAPGLQRPPAAQVRQQKAVGTPATVQGTPSKRKTPATRKQPVRSPLSTATPASAVTPAAGLKATATPSAAASGSAAPSTIKTHQRRRKSAALGSADTPAAPLAQQRSKAAGGAQTAPEAVGAKRKARTADYAKAATLSPGTRKRRRATMPAGKALCMLGGNLIDKQLHVPPSSPNSYELHSMSKHSTTGMTIVLAASTCHVHKPCQCKNHLR